MNFGNRMNQRREEAPRTPLYTSRVNPYLNSNIPSKDLCGQDILTPEAQKNNGQRLIHSLFPMLNQEISQNDPRLLGSAPQHTKKLTKILEPRVITKFEDNLNLSSFSRESAGANSRYSVETPIIQDALATNSKEHSKFGVLGDEKVNERGFLGFDSIEMDNGNSRIFHDNLHSQTIDELNVKVPNSEDNAHSLKAIGHSTLEFSSKKLTPRQRWRKAIRKVIIRNKERKVENKLFGRKILNLGDDPLSTRCIILPSSMFKMIWSIIMIIVLSFTVIYIPIRLAFIEKVNRELLVIECIVDGIFMLDIFFNFITAYYDKNHTLITRKKFIVKSYLKGWFIIDILACTPIFLISLSNEESDDDSSSIYNILRLGRLYRIVKLFRLIRILKVIKGSRMYEKFLLAMKMNAGIKRLIKTIMTFFIFMHFFACAWFYQSRILGFEPDSWVMRYGIRDLSSGHQYLISFYWVTTLSTIGYGDIIPYTRNERILSMIFIIVGVGFVSYAIGSLSSIMLNSDSKTQILKKKLLALDELALHLDIDSNLYYQIKRIIRNMNHETLMEELPTTLRSQILSLIFQKNNLGSIAFFHGKSPYFICDILPLLKRITLEKDEVIYRHGDYIDEMYFILKGTVQLVSEDHYIFSTFSDGSYFGECDILNKTNFRSEYAISSERCELVTIQKCELLKLFEGHDGIKQEMISIMEKRNTRNTNALNKARGTNSRLDDQIIKNLRCKRQSSIFNQTCFPPISPVTFCSTFTHPQNSENFELELFATNSAGNCTSKSSQLDSDSDSSNNSSDTPYDGDNLSSCSPTLPQAEIKEVSENEEDEQENIGLFADELGVKGIENILIPEDNHSVISSYRDQPNDEMSEEKGQIESYNFRPNRCYLRRSRIKETKSLTQISNNSKTKGSGSQPSENVDYKKISVLNHRRSMLGVSERPSKQLRRSVLGSKYSKLFNTNWQGKRVSVRVPQIAHLSPVEAILSKKMTAIHKEIRKTHQMNMKSMRHNMEMWDTLNNKMNNIDQNKPLLMKTNPINYVQPPGRHKRQSFFSFIPPSNVMHSIKYRKSLK